MGRLGLDNAIDAIATVRGGLSAGIYPCNASGFTTYTSSGTDEYTGVTFDSTYNIYYFEVDAEGARYPVQLLTGSPFTLSLGVNAGKTITSAYGNPSVDVVMILADTLTVTNTPDEWFYAKSDIVVTGAISGGAYNDTIPNAQYVNSTSTETYIGGYTPALGWGDYTLALSVTDPNGDVTQASNNDAITAKFQPKTFITAYRLDGVNWISDVEPIPEVSGYETIDLQYVINTDYSLESDGSPVYDVDGSIGTVGGTIVTEVAVALGTGENSLSIGNIADSGGALQASEPFLITRIPALRYDGLTTVDEETYGTSYDGALSLIVDEGLSNESNVTPDEAPYTFTSGDYKVYNFTASYSYPSGESNSVAVAITYQELAINPFEIKIFNYTTDEHLFLDDQDNITPLVEPNDNPSALMVLNHISQPDYVDVDQPYYHAPESLENFKQVPSQGLIDPIPVPQMRYGLQVSAGKENYYSNVGLGANIFKPETAWAISGFFYGAGSFYVCGRQGLTSSNGTSLYADNGNLVVKVGGTDYTTPIAYDTSLVHYFRWQERFTGSIWVDDLILDETVVYTGRSTERGTNIANVYATVGSVFNVDTNVNPVTDARQGVGGSYSAFRYNDSEWTDKQTSSLYYRYYQHMCFCMGGDSITEGVNSSGQPWWVQEKENGERYEYNVSYVCTARGGSEAARSLPTTPIGDWTAKPPWQTVVDPNAMQTCEYIRDTFDPELYIDAFGYNDISAQYNVENPNAGIDSTPSSLGWNSYADMLYWMAKSKKNWYDVNSIEYYSVQAFANSNTSLRYDSVERRDMARFVNDLMIANATGLEDDFLIYSWYETREVGTNNADPSYVTDGVHYNAVGSTAIRNTIVTKTELDKRFEATRNNNFTPKVKFIDPVLDGTVLTTPYDVVYRGDGVETTVSTILAEGSNLITKQHTNAKGVTGQKTNDITYSATPPFDGFKYDLTSAVSNEFVDTSGNGLNATIKGVESFVGGKWDLNIADGDYCYTVGTEADMATDEEWCHSLWYTAGAKGSGEVLFGKLDSGSFGDSLCLYRDRSAMKQIAFGTILTVGTTQAEFVEAHYGWQNRLDGATWYLDTYQNGILIDSTATRGTGSTTLPILLGCAVASSSDPEAAIGFCNDGEFRDYSFERVAKTTQQWLDIYNAGPLP